MRTRLLVLTLLLAACGGGTSSPPDAGIPDAGLPDGPLPLGEVALVDLPATLEAVVCTFEVRCGLMPDLATCQEVFDPSATSVPQLAAHAASGALIYDPVQAGACLTAYRDAACSWNGDTLGLIDGCAQVFVGDKAPGVACLLDEECTGDSICETVPCPEGCCTGTCKPRAAPVGVGGDCSGAPCAEGAYCRLHDAGQATCTALAPAGGACEAIDACAPGSLCQQGTCVALAAAGASCQPGGCRDVDHFCDGGTCQPRRAATAACADDGACIEAAACVAGSCRIRPRPGEACGPTGPGCLGDGPCVSGVCRVEPAHQVCP
jgi:hypothetical protein